MMMGFGFMGIVAMLLFWGLLIAGAVWLVRSIFPGSVKTEKSSEDRSMSSREILNQRYARGEITREQYKTMVNDLIQLGNS